MSFINIIEGLHEIHITVDSRDLFALRMYCMDTKTKPILAISEYGNHPIQAMLSKYKNGKALEIICLAKEMANQMSQKYNIRVLRVKVESMMHNEGVPVLENDEKDDQFYFEFHLKVSVENSDNWQKISNICKTDIAHLSFNAAKKETIPLITLRLPVSLGSNKAVKLKDDLLHLLRINNILVFDGIQSEFSVFDSNIELDKGWLS
ncbi:MAG: hypothetical protein WD512_02570 [Candidatus Paceibacterota bacterium]